MRLAFLSNNRYLISILLYTCSLALFFSLTTHQQEVFDRQLLLAPLIILILLIIQIPKIAIAALMISTASINFHNGTYSWHRGQEILLARFDNDPLLKRATRWKNIFNLNNSFSARILPTTAANTQQAEELAAEHEALVVWSNHHRLALTPPRAPVFDGDQRLKRISALSIIVNIPEIPFRDGNKLEGVAFIKNLTQALFHFNRGDTIGEAKLLKLSTAKGRWSSRQHLAYPLFVVGTSQLRQAFSLEAPTLHNVRCAIKTLKRADRLLAQSRTPSALSVAVHNNLGVAHAIEYRYTKKQRFLTEAITSFTMARGQNKAIARHSYYNTSSIPLENMATLKLPKAKEKKQKKNKITGTKKSI